MSAGLLTRARIAMIRETGRFGVTSEELDALCDLALTGMFVRETEARREAHRRNCPLCGVANPEYRDGACQSCGEPGK